MARLGRSTAPPSIDSKRLSGTAGICRALRPPVARFLAVWRPSHSRRDKQIAGSESLLF